MKAKEVYQVVIISLIIALICAFNTMIQNGII